MEKTMRTTIVAGALVAFAGSANAGFVVDMDPAVLPGTENVLFNDDTLITQGPMVQGITNQNRLVVDWFGAGEDLMTEGARITAVDAGLTQFSVDMNYPTLGIASYQFNLDALKSGDVTINIYEMGSLSYSQTVSVDEQGPNFFRVYGTDKEVMSMITIVSDVEIGAISRNRIEAVPEPVPEPSALVALGIGMALLAARRRR
jgi:hypothetical protein